MNWLQWKFIHLWSPEVQYYWSSASFTFDFDLVLVVLTLFCQATKVWIYHTLFLLMNKQITCSWNNCTVGCTSHAVKKFPLTLFFLWLLLPILLLLMMMTLELYLGVYSVIRLFCSQSVDLKAVSNPLIEIGVQHTKTLIGHSHVRWAFWTTFQSSVLKHRPFISLIQHPNINIKISIPTCYSRWIVFFSLVLLGW